MSMAVNPQNDLERLILIMFSGNYSSEDVNNANFQILSLIETEMAWSLSLSLLQAERDFVQFFVANILYTKIRKHWSQLAESQRLELFTLYRDTIAKISQSPLLLMQRKPYVNRVLLSFVGICSRHPEGIQTYIGLACNLIAEGHSSVDMGLGMDIGRLLTGLEMLHILPGEISTVDVSRAARLDYQSTLQSSLSRVLVLSDSLSVVWVASSLHTQIQIQNSTEADLQHRQRLILQTQLTCLKTLRTWLSQGLTLTALYTEHVSIWRFFSWSLCSGSKELVVECCGALGDVLDIGEHPRPVARNEAVHALVVMFTTNAAALAPFFGRQNDDSNSKVMSTLVGCETFMLCSVQYYNTALFQLLLSCLSQRQRRLASLTFDAWIAIQDVPPADRHPNMTR
eukprot:gene4149-8250_t